MTRDDSHQPHDDDRGDSDGQPHCDPDRTLTPLEVPISMWELVNEAVGL